MKFKGQGKINICGFEYKKNIADSRRGGGGGGGGVRTPKKKPVSAPEYTHIVYTVSCTQMLAYTSGSNTPNLYAVTDL